MVVIKRKSVVLRRFTETKMYVHEMYKIGLCVFYNYSKRMSIYSFCLLLMYCNDFSHYTCIFDKTILPLYCTLCHLCAYTPTVPVYYIKIKWFFTKYINTDVWQCALLHFAKNTYLYGIVWLNMSYNDLFESSRNWEVRYEGGRKAGLGARESLFRRSWIGKWSRKKKLS